MKKCKFSIISLIVVLMLIFTACGGSSGSASTPAASSKYPREHVLPGLLFYTKVITGGCVQHHHQGVTDMGSSVDRAVWVALDPQGPQSTLHVGWLVQSPVTLHTFPGHSRSSELLTVAYNFQILTSSPDLPVLRLFPLQTYVHGPQSKAPLGWDRSSRASCLPPFPLPTLLSQLSARSLSS